MQKVAQAVPPAQDNPLVRIEYQPANALAELSSNTAAMLTRLQLAKVTNVKSLESATEVIRSAQVTEGEIDTFIDTLRERIQQAAEKFRLIPGFEDFSITLTVRQWSLRQRLTAAIWDLKNARAKFLSDEQERVKREQAEKQAAQDRINREAAQKAAAAAKKQGADAATVRDIKESVLATPAPIVESKAVTAAQDAGVSLRYAYTAQITNLKQFLGTCLNNPVLFNTLSAAIPDIEKAFRKMANDQKEAFSYAGIMFKKTPVDVGRR